MAAEKERKYGTAPRQLYNDGGGMVREEYEFQAITPGCERLLAGAALEDVFERLLTRISDCRDRLHLRDIRTNGDKKALAVALAKMNRPPQFKVRDAIKFVLLREWGTPIAPPVAAPESFGPPPVADDENCEKMKPLGSDSDEVKAARIKKGREIIESIEKRGRPALGKPWEAEGISRSTWMRRRKDKGDDNAK